MKKDNFIPFFINLENKKILVVGGGNIAYRKAKTLKESGGIITILSEKILCEEIYNIVNHESQDIIIEKLSTDKRLLEKFLEKIEFKKFFLIAAATNNSELNDKIFEISNRTNILVNNVTSQEEMNLRFCSVYEDENFKIGISGKGNPKVSKIIKEKIIRFFEELK